MRVGFYANFAGAVSTFQAYTAHGEAPTVENAVERGMAFEKLRMVAGTEVFSAATAVHLFCNVGMKPDTDPKEWLEAAAKVMYPMTLAMRKELNLATDDEPKEIVGAVAGVLGIDPETGEDVDASH